jgi:hypothetical protein
MKVTFEPWQLSLKEGYRDKKRSVMILNDLSVQNIRLHCRARTRIYTYRYIHNTHTYIHRYMHAYIHREKISLVTRPQLMSLSVSVCPSICLFTCIYLLTYLLILSTYLSPCLWAYNTYLPISVCFSVYLCVCVWPSICPSVSPAIYRCNV